MGPSATGDADNCTARFASRDVVNPEYREIATTEELACLTAVPGEQAREPNAAADPHAGPGQFLDQSDVERSAEGEESGAAWPGL